MSIAIQTFSDKDFAPSDTTCRSEEHHENFDSSAMMIALIQV
jgi:hypothetical protein